MAEMTEVLVVQPGRLRVVLVSTGLILSALLLLGWAAGAVFVASKVDFILARIILVLWALGVVAIGIFSSVALEHPRVAN